MKSCEFTEWRERLKMKKIDAASALGCSKNTITHYESGGRIPRYIALACSAIALNLPPYGDDK